MNFFIMNEKSTPVKVLILGKEYRVSCNEDERNELLAAAQYLDHKMRQIRDTGRVMGTERIAVMAALNIAHELAQAQQRNKMLTQKLAESESAPLIHDFSPYDGTDGIFNG